MARRLVTVGDDLVLHSSVTVPFAQVTGAGDVAGLDVGTTAGTVAAGDDSRITGALPAANLDTAATALDANAASALRVQQDARHSATFARDLAGAAPFDSAAPYTEGALVKYNGAVWARTAQSLAATTTRTQYVINPRFRDNRAGWTVGSSVTATISGDKCVLTLGADKTTGVSLLFPTTETATVEGEVWSTSVYVEVPRAATAAATVRLAIAAYPTTDNVKTTDVTIQPGTGQLIKVENATIPAGKTLVRAVLYAGTSTLPSDTVLHVSSPILEKGATVGAFFDGDTADAPGAAHTWTGTRYSSTQTRTATDSRPGASGTWRLVKKAPVTRGHARAPFKPSVEGDNVTRYPAHLDASRTRMLSYQSASLAITTDDTDNWTVIETFTHPVRSLRFLDNGEAIVSTRSVDDASPHELWLSTGLLADPAAATWTKVMDGLTNGNGPANGWSWSVHGPMIAVADYGAKAGADNARHVYLSLNYGKTWATIFDLGTQVGNHLHGVIIDPYWDRIWVTYGDDTSGILYSDDLGTTWQVAQSTSAAADPYQVVGGIALPDCILFGTDGSPNGVLRISRSQGKYTPDRTYTLETAHAFNETSTITHLCHSIFRAERPGDDAPVVFGFGPETVSGTSRVLVTPDGYDFTEVWADPLTTNAGRGVQVALGPTARGSLVLNANDERYGSGMTRWKGRFPAAY